MSFIASGRLEGPFEQGFWFELPGHARSKSNARRFARTSRAGAKERRAYRAEQTFAAQVRTIAEATVPAGWPIAADRELADRPQVVAAMLAVTTLDTTNVPKSILDAVHGVVYHDDASVRAATQQTVRGRRPVGAVAFAWLPADATVRQVHTANQALAGLLLQAAGDRLDES